MWHMLLYSSVIMYKISGEWNTEKLFFFALGNHPRLYCKSVLLLSPCCEPDPLW